MLEKRIGRLTFLLVSFVLSSIFTTVTAILYLHELLETYVIIFILVAKYFMGLTFSVIWLYAIEVRFGFDR